MGEFFVVIYSMVFFFRSAHVVTLATPFPSVRTGDCLAAARSRRGSDMPPACHSLPRRRCTPLKGAALRGKDFSLAQGQRAAPLGAPSRGAGASRLRGRQSWVIAIREKTGQCIDPLCHSEERSDVGIRSPYVGTRFRTL